VREIRRVTPGIPALPATWHRALADETRRSYFRELNDRLSAERAAGPVYPPTRETFAALTMTPPEAVRVILLGQDPYHGPGQAHGLSFSVPPGVTPPPSLRNMLRELRDDLGILAPGHGNLRAWALRGVLLLNTVLTVRGGQAGSHCGLGWERFTDRII